MARCGRAGAAGQVGPGGCSPCAAAELPGTGDRRGPAGRALRGGPTGGAASRTPAPHAPPRGLSGVPVGQAGGVCVWVCRCVLDLGTFCRNRTQICPSTRPDGVFFFLDLFGVSNLEPNRLEIKLIWSSTKEAEFNLQSRLNPQRRLSPAAAPPSASGTRVGDAGTARAEVGRHPRGKAR